MERLTRWAPLALGILRIVAALLFIEHGTQKLFGFPVPAMGPAEGLMLVAALIEIPETGADREPSGVDLAGIVAKGEVDRLVIEVVISEVGRADGARRAGPNVDLDVAVEAAEDDRERIDRRDAGDGSRDGGLLEAQAHRSGLCVLGRQRGRDDRARQQDGERTKKCFHVGSLRECDSIRQPLYTGTGGLLRAS